MDLELAGKRAIIIGASRGIGKATAARLKDEGAKVAIGARNGDRLKAAADEIGADWHRPIDIRDAEAIGQWIAFAATALGGVDILVPAPSAAASAEGDWAKVFETDLMGPVRSIEAALPHLELSSAASVILIGTIAASTPFAGPTAYAALKAALTAHAGQLAVALASKKIRVNAVAPGPIAFDGGFWQRVEREQPDAYQQVVARSPFERLGTAEEVADTIAFLASPRGGFITGSVIPIDGGYGRRLQF